LPRNILTVGFPPKELNPNRHVHWSKKEKARKAYTKEVWASALAAKIEAPGTDRILLRLHFYPPSTHRRKADDDNLVASFKHGRDGLATALKVDDQCFRSEPILYAPGLAGKHGKLVIEVFPYPS